MLNKLIHLEITLPLWNAYFKSSPGGVWISNGVFHLLKLQTYVDVIVLNLSWPAVSQICNFTLSPLISMVRILKSTPIVVI